jgi:hypothetical protein
VEAEELATAGPLLREREREVASWWRKGEGAPSR